MQSTAVAQALITLLLIILVHYAVTEYESATHKNFFVLSYDGDQINTAVLIRCSMQVEKRESQKKEAAVPVNDTLLVSLRLCVQLTLRHCRVLCTNQRIYLDLLLLTT